MRELIMFGVQLRRAMRFFALVMAMGTLLALVHMIAYELRWLLRRHLIEAKFRTAFQKNFKSRRLVPLEP